MIESWISLMKAVQSIAGPLDNVSNIPWELVRVVVPIVSHSAQAGGVSQSSAVFLVETASGASVESCSAPGNAER